MSSHTHQPAVNPFCKTQDRRKGKEKLVTITFMIFTYTVLFCAFVIFGNIIWKGAPVLAEKGLSFLTEKPQTLSVLEVEQADGIEVPAKNFDSMLSSNGDDRLPIANVRTFDKSYKMINFDLLPDSIIGEGYLKDLEQQNDNFYLRYDERTLEAPVAFTLQQDKAITLTEDAYKTVKELAPNLIPADVKSRESKLSDFEVTIAKGEYMIGKGTHDALVNTPLIFKMKQTFADDDAGNEFPCIIPETQTITVDGGTFFTAFDEDESGTLPLEDQKDIPVVKNFYDFTIPAGTYQTNDKVLAILANMGVPTKHNTAKGSIVVNLGKAINLTTSASEYETLIAANPGIKVDNATPAVESEPFVSFTLKKDSEVLLNAEDYEQIKAANEGTNNFKTSSEHTHSYSGGGVLGPIIGTAILVIICMAIALTTGIASAVFLTEYAAQGRFIKTIRLAMLNLAGVPSIVFGLFGLGLFVMIAPALTSTPSAESKFIVPIAPVASEPNLRVVEQEKIYIAEDKASISELRELTATAGDTRFYDGWYYLSFQGWGTCMLAGGFTLAIMILPVIITSCEESLRAVPQGFREASLALGASKWQSIRTAVLPYAFPGILTASVLGITRVAGETAPIMFTAAVAERSDLPWQGIHSLGFDRFIDFLQQSVQALPYHIYTVAGRIPQSEYTQPMQYGAVLVFMIIVMSLAGFSVWLRIRVRNKIKW
ncbi:Binding-protein-dependent transport system inner membrane component [Rubritalea squalenifaciens DSM 18772]|uniref:Binding-protein-dependent transport system inner membrane component n=1 Tax=Rubritalea squalenifaciens DSM 18772 TaxID=1123071 RepID=A0A1M6ES74_9BACT|nr:ABC transporter permease subunit [Rubritalea squalenifaciens]SHI88263.1 Binding-protein-dependent transport system inner membrane component [Rubritalea squalenifaciens DSM 18772]